ncbi:putative ribonuclease H-like domain-containing protein, partial [Tanacetum coccineum]
MKSIVKLHSANTRYLREGRRFSLGGSVTPTLHGKPSYMSITASTIARIWPRSAPRQRNMSATDGERKTSARIRCYSLNFDDLYNNLRGFENDVKGSTASSSSTQNVAFVSENTSSTNDVSTVYSVSNTSGQNSQYEQTSSYSLLANQSSCPQLDHEDLEQLDEFDLEEMDLKWQVAMISMRMKKFYKKTVAHQQSQLWYEEKIRFMKIDLDDKTDVLTYHKKLLAEAEKEKEDLKAKVEKWHNSSKNLSILLNSQMSANDKFRLGYGDYRYDGILSYENKVLQSVFMNKESDLENQPLYDRFVTAEGMHVVPPPMTGNYMPSGPDIEIDYSQFTYGPKQSQASESETQTSDFDTCDSNCSDETHESLPEPAVNEPKVVSQPKVWSDAPIIEEYESDSEDEHVSLPTEEQETPSFANKQVKTPRETVKNQFTHSKNPKVDKKGLGYGFTTKACFVCGSLSHLIRDCDFHEKRMAKQAELNNRMRKKSSQREIRPIWNNVQRMNHRNQFVPKAVLTRTGKIPVNTARASGTNTVNIARHNVNRQAVPTNAANIVNTVKPIVNNARPKINTAEVNAVSAVGGKRETADYPHRALQNKGIIDSGCSRHMTRNKVYLAEYQDFNGGSVAFGGSKGYITGKGKIKTGKLDFKDMCFVKELQHFNIFSVSQICDKKKKVLFTDSECLVLSPEFKLPDANQVLLRIPRQNNMYSFNLENIVPSVGLACLIAKATIDEFKKWHRRLGHVNFKNLNKLVKGNLVRGLPSKIFHNDHTCVACQKGKQHKASFNTASTPVSTVSPYDGLSFSDPTDPDQDDSEIPALEDIYKNPTDGIFTNSTSYDEGAVADFTNLETVVNVSPIPTSRINFIHPSTLILKDLQSTVQTRSKVTKSSGAHDFVSYIQKQRRNNHKNFQHCLFACFLSQNEPNKISESLEDESWVDAMQEELLQFKIKKVWILIDLPYGKKEIGTKWVYRNKKDERGVMVRNKARLVAQGH